MDVISFAQNPIEHLGEPFRAISRIDFGLNDCEQIIPGIAVVYKSKPAS
jgi:hypothetical protein